MTSKDLEGESLNRHLDILLGQSRGLKRGFSSFHGLVTGFLRSQNRDLDYVFSLINPTGAETFLEVRSLTSKYAIHVYEKDYSKNGYIRRRD